jgi:hypothetical protein
MEPEVSFTGTLHCTEDFEAFEYYGDPVISRKFVSISDIYRRNLDAISGSL